MLGLDEWLADAAHGSGLLTVLAIALLLGLRHASDPDHLAAVSTLLVSDPDDGGRRASRLGLAWGAGHALTLAAFGLPIVLGGAYLPDAAQHAAEALVGLVIIVLAARLLIRWREGRLDAHEHRRGGIAHREAFGIGLVHGVGGSAGVGVILLAAAPSEEQAVAALFVLAAGTAVSMALLSSGFGWAITRGPVVARTVALAPAMAMLTLLFGCWYTLGAVL